MEGIVLESTFFHATIVLMVFQILGDTDKRTMSTFPNQFNMLQRKTSF